MSDISVESNGFNIVYSAPVDQKTDVNKTDIEIIIEDLSEIGSIMYDNKWAIFANVITIVSFVGLSTYSVKYYLNKRL
jgi:hypothetical protein